jgi:uncharacterized protein (TIGR00369 family)
VGFDQSCRPFVPRRQSTPSTLRHHARRVKMTEYPRGEVPSICSWDPSSPAVNGEVHSLTDDTATNAAATQGAISIPLHARMGLKILKRGKRTIASMELNDEVRGAFDGSVHGGMLATLADVTCALSTWGSYDADAEVPVTTDMHVRFYRQPDSGPITAEATLVHDGRRILTSECSIVDGKSRELARATATFMVVPRP